VDGNPVTVIEPDRPAPPDGQEYTEYRDVKILFRLGLHGQTRTVHVAIATDAELEAAKEIHRRPGEQLVTVEGWKR
jgi:hypothetical protein